MSALSLYMISHKFILSRTAYKGKSEGITEQLKQENALEWVQKMNNIWACAKEIVEKEIIFA